MTGIVYATIVALTLFFAFLIFYAGKGKNDEDWDSFVEKEREEELAKKRLAEQQEEDRRRKRRETEEKLTTKWTEYFEQIERPFVKQYLHLFQNGEMLFFDKNFHPIFPEDFSNKETVSELTYVFAKTDSAKEILFSILIKPLPSQFYKDYSFFRLEPVSKYVTVKNLDFFDLPGIKTIVTDRYGGKFMLAFEDATRLTIKQVEELQIKVLTYDEEAEAEREEEKERLEQFFSNVETGLNGINDELSNMRDCMNRPQIGFLLK